MTKEEELLLRDLCARLSYGVKGVNMAGIVSSPSDWYCTFGILSGLINRMEYSEWKPYLFPMSHLTDEQCREIEFLAFSKRYGEIAEIYNRNHIDYRGLIEKGLAIDCTNLNIY